MSFKTSHTGSLPRPQDLLDLMFAREGGAAVDQAALDAAIERATAYVLDRQMRAGISVIGDGEMSKPSYATYIKHRLSGFGGEAGQYEFEDLERFPGAKARVFGDTGRARRSAPACTAPIEVIDMDAPREDAERLTRLAGGHETFMSAASPGVTALFFPNQFYASDEAYVFALAEGLRHEYETIAAAGITLQVDCPDLAMGRHVQFTHLSTEEFRKRIGMNVAALNHALANIPAEQLRMHLCWGNYPGPHHLDVPLGSIIDIIYGVRAGTLVLAGASPQHRADWRLFARSKLPAGMTLAAGVIDTSAPGIEAPVAIADAIVQVAGVVGPGRVMAATDCGFAAFAGAPAMPAGVAELKIQALRAGADMATRRLWRATAAA